jgi:tripartite ATP-independent transporter DctM subunit
MEDYVLLSIPLYILLGEILVPQRQHGPAVPQPGGLAEPAAGGLLHTNVGASAIFSAVSGSSVATAATGRDGGAALLPEAGLRREAGARLDRAGASLGNLIPPGIALIVYGAMTNTSIGQLYAAAVVPGIVMTLLFMATIVVIALVRPDAVRQKEALDPLMMRLKRLVDLLPPLVVFTIIMGSIYTGWATVTESAALAWWRRCPSRRSTAG